MNRGSKPQISSKPSAAERAAQSARDKAKHRAEMMQVAALRSIPKGAPRKKTEIFTRGALRTPQFAPRGHGYYDAFVQSPDSAVVSATTGPATVITGYSSDTIVGGAVVTGTYAIAGSPISAPYSGNAILIAFNPGSSDNRVAEVFRVVADPVSGALSLSVQSVFCSQFNELGPTRTEGKYDIQEHDGNPDALNLLPTRRVESIPLRGSLRIRNLTEALSVGGAVRALRYNGGVNINDDVSGPSDPPWENSVRGFVDLCAMIRDAPRTKVFNGQELRDAHQSNTYPADFVRSMRFESDRSFREELRAPSYCTLFVLIDDFASSTNLTNNTYEITVKVQRAARFAMGSLLGGMARTLSVRPLHGEHAKEEQKHPLYLTS